MQPTLARPPFHRGGWIYEEKVDGYKAGDVIRLLREARIFGRDT